MLLSIASRGSGTLFAVILCMGVINLVIGISFPLFSLTLNATGASDSFIGLSGLVQACAVFAIAPLAPRLINELSPGFLMRVLCLILAGLSVSLIFLTNHYLWLPMRFLIGACTSLLWISGETLVNQIVDDENRGKVVGIYGFVGGLGFALGPLLLLVTGSKGDLPYLALGAFLIAAALVIWCVTDSTAAATEEALGQEDRTGKDKGICWFLIAAPIIILANFVYAANAEAFGTFFPLFGMSAGISEERALGLMTVMGLGGTLLVIPLCWLADYMDRYNLLLFSTFIGMLGLLFMPEVIDLHIIGPVYMFVLGGFDAVIYVLGVVLIGERFKGRDLVGATTLFTMAWGLGAMAGPAFVGVSFDLYGESIFPYTTSMFFLVYLLLAAFFYKNRYNHTGAAADE